MPARKVKGTYVTTELGKRLVASAQSTDAERDEKGEAYARLGKFTYVSNPTAWDAYKINGTIMGTTVKFKLPQPHEFTPTYTPAISIKALTAHEQEVAHALLSSLPQDKACALHAGNAIVIKEVVTSLCGLGVDLLPTALSTKTTFSCDCPEYQNRARDFGNVNLAPCKHLMGLVFVLAGRVDQRPIHHP